MRRVPILSSACLLTLLVGCTRPPAATNSGSGAQPSEEGEVSATRAELARRDADLAAARAQVADLRRRLDERPAPGARPDGGPPTVPAAGPDGLTQVARQRLHEGAVTSVAFSPAGTAVASTDALGQVLVSDANDLSPIRTLEAATGAGVQNSAHSVCFTPDGRHVAVGSDDRTVWIWRVADGELVKRIRGHQDAVEYVSFLSDGKGGLSFDRQGVGLSWSVHGARRELIPDRRLRKVAVTPDGELLVWSDGGRTLYGPPSRETPPTTLGGFADALAVSRDGELVAKGASANCVELWDAPTGTRRWAGARQPGRVQALAFSSDGKKLVALASGALSVWDVQTGDETCRFRVRPEDGSSRIALAPDGRTLAVGNRRGVLTIVRLPK